jgi:hypothetical protein
MKAKAIPLTKAAVEAAAEELRRERAFVAKFEPRPPKEELPEEVSLTPEQEERALAMVSHGFNYFESELRATRLVVHHQDEIERLQGRAAALNRCIDNIRELCEDNLCNVPYLRVVMDEIAMIGPMYERASPAVPYLCDATRFKLSFDSKGRVSALCHFAKELDGRWVALVPAENDSHMRYAERASHPPRTAPEAPEKTWDCSICGRSNYVTVTHCEQCEYSRMVMQDGLRVPRVGR